MMRERAVPLRRLETAKKPTAAYSPPTDEQLANFVAATVTAVAQEAGLPTALSPRLAALMLEAHLPSKRGWLQRHREFQDRLTHESRKTAR